MLRWPIHMDWMPFSTCLNWIFLTRRILFRKSSLKPFTRPKTRCFLKYTEFMPSFGLNARPTLEFTQLQAHSINSSTRKSTTKTPYKSFTRPPWPTVKSYPRPNPPFVLQRTPRDCSTSRMKSCRKPKWSSTWSEVTIVLCWTIFYLCTTQGSKRKDGPTWGTFWPKQSRWSSLTKTQGLFTHWKKSTRGSFTCQSPSLLGMSSWLSSRKSDGLREKETSLPDQEKQPSKS